VLEPNQPARVDHISPKMWVARIKRFEKKPFESLLSVLFKFLPKLKYARTFISVIGIFA
jgi:hypothetical protein